MIAIIVGLIITLVALASAVLTAKLKVKTLFSGFLTLWLLSTVCVGVPIWAAYSFVSWVVSPSPQPAADHKKAAEPPPPPLTENQLGDAKALDERYGDQARVSCGARADRYLRGVLTRDFKWDDGFLDFKFDQYRAMVKSTGVITMISDKLLVQNGFGAYRRTQIKCDYDVLSGKVLGFDF